MGVKKLVKHIIVIEIRDSLWNIIKYNNDNHQHIHKLQSNGLIVYG